MTTNAVADSELRKRAIGELVKKGVIKNEHSGLYMDPNMTEGEVSSIPPYETSRIVAAYPDILQIDVEEKREGDKRWFELQMHDGKQSNPEIVRVEKIPADTDELIAIIRSHFDKLYDMSALEAEKDDLFGGID